MSFKVETAGSIELLNARAKTSEAQAPSRFFDTALTGVTATGMTAEQITYVGLQSTALADTVVGLEATFLNKTIATPPAGFPQITKQNFQVFINGVATPMQNITSIMQINSDIIVTFTDLGFALDSTDQIVLVGKFS